MPTGVALRDPRGQLFAAAERILLRDGPAALTSRAVTAEAGVAKGVLHRHFADFDAFLTELAQSRLSEVAVQADTLRAAAGTGTVTGNLAAALPGLFSPALLALIRLVIARDELRTRLREAAGTRLPPLSEATGLVAGYLAAERDLGRIAPGADISALAPALIGAAHLLFTDAQFPGGQIPGGQLAGALLPGTALPDVRLDGAGAGAPDAAAVDRMVTAVLAGSVR